MTLAEPRPPRRSSLPVLLIDTPVHHQDRRSIELVPIRLPMTTFPVGVASANRDACSRAESYDVCGGRRRPADGVTGGA